MQVPQLVHTVCTVQTVHTVVKYIHLSRYLKICKTYRGLLENKLYRNLFSEVNFGSRLNKLKVHHRVAIIINFHWITLPQSVSHI